MAKDVQLRVAGANKKVLQKHIRVAGANKTVTAAWIKTAAGPKQIWPLFSAITSSWTGSSNENKDNVTFPADAGAEINFRLNNTENFVVDLDTNSNTPSHSVSWSISAGNTAGDHGGRFTNPITSAGGLGPKYRTFTDIWRSAGTNNDIWVYVIDTGGHVLGTKNTWVRLNSATPVEWNVIANQSGSTGADFDVGTIYFTWDQTGATPPSWTPTTGTSDGSWSYVARASVGPSV